MGFLGLRPPRADALAAPVSLACPAFAPSSRFRRCRQPKGLPRTSKPWEASWQRKQSPLPRLFSVAAAALIGFASRLGSRRNQKSRAVSTSRSAGQVGSQRPRWRLSWTEVDSEIRRVWLPAVANLMIQPLVGTVDLFWAGRSGNVLDIAGMGVANQVYYAIFFFISFLPAVVTPRVAEEIARDRKAAAAEYVREALGFAFLLGLFGSLVLVFLPEHVVGLLTSNPGVAASAVPYVRFRGLSLIATLWTSVSFAIFRGLLEFMTPLRVLLLANVINVILDPILMMPCGLGVAGVAAATSVAEVVAASIFMVLLYRRGFLVKFPRLPSWSQLKPLLGSGLAVQVRSVSTNAIFILAVQRVTAVDPSGIQAAAYQVTIQFWNLAGYVSLGLSTAGSGLMPNKFYREGGVDAARKVADRLLLWGCLLGLLLGGLQLAALPLVGVMAPIKEVQQAALVPSILAAGLQVFAGACFAGEGVLLGLKAYPYLAASSGVGCLLMAAIIQLSGEHALLGIWLGFYAFNIARLCGSLSHRFKFGPLAQPATRVLAESTTVREE